MSSRSLRPRQDRQPALGEEAAQPLGLLAGVVGQVGQAADLAAQPLAFLEGGEGLLVAAEPVEQPAFFQQLVGVEAAVAVLGGGLSRTAAPRS